MLCALLCVLFIVPDIVVGSIQPSNPAAQLFLIEAAAAAGDAHGQRPMFWVS
jgi:hypothetical protein